MKQPYQSTAIAAKFSVQMPVSQYLNEISERLTNSIARTFYPHVPSSTCVNSILLIGQKVMLKLIQTDEHWFSLHSLCLPAEVLAGPELRMVNRWQLTGTQALNRADNYRMNGWILSFEVLCCWKCPQISPYLGLWAGSQNVSHRLMSPLFCTWISEAVVLYNLVWLQIIHGLADYSCSRSSMAAGQLLPSSSAVSDPIRLASDGERKPSLARYLVSLSLLI